MGVCQTCQSTKNKKNTKEKVNLPDSTEIEKPKPAKLSSDFIEDDVINKNDYNLQTQIALEATKEEIEEAQKHKIQNHDDGKLRAARKVYYRQVKIEKKSDGTVIRTTIENGKKIVETFKPKKNNNNNNSNRNNINNSNRNNINHNVYDSNKVDPGKNSGRKILNNNNNNNIRGSTFQEEALKAHNEYRRKHHSPNLVLNSELNTIAQNYANKIAKLFSLGHSSNEYKNEPLGENIYMCQGMKPTGRDMTKSWYDEINKYDFNSKQFIRGTGHFTQLVWKNSKEVGFGIAQSDDGSYFCVANYFPCGNYLGEFSENVLRP